MACLAEDLLPRSPTWCCKDSVSPRLLDRSCSPLTVGHTGPFIGQLTTWPLASSSKREDSRWKPLLFYNLIPAVIAHYFCHILFIQNESLGPAHIKGGWSYKSMNIIRYETSGTILEAAYRNSSRTPSPNSEIATPLKLINITYKQVYTLFHKLMNTQITYIIDFWSSIYTSLKLISLSTCIYMYIYAGYI